VGGVDLSQAATAALAAVLGTALITQSATAALARSVLWDSLLTQKGGVLAHSPGGAIAACLAMVAIGAAVGLVNGLSVVVLRISAFMVTLVTSTLLGGLATFLTQSENIGDLPQSFTAIGGTPGEWFSTSMVLAMLLAATTHVVLTRTLFG